jgi:Flp pilus assembly protein TadD
VSRFSIIFAGVAVSLCIALPAAAVDTPSSKDAPDLTTARAKIKAKDWQAAATELRELAKFNQHADVYNLLAFSLRNMGQYAEARTLYFKALDFDPDHKGAHEYLGELYVKTGEMDKARVMLVQLQKICANGCEELDDLKSAIAEADAKAAAKTN